MHWLELEHMILYNKHLLWDTFTIDKIFTKCANKDNSYYCGPIDIRFIGLDSIGASLEFTHDMVTYRYNLQYSIATLTYDYLGIKTMIPIVDTVPENP